MMQVTPQMRILVMVESVDFRRGIDGLAHVVRERLAEDPLSGCVFVFRNRRSTAIKVLVYDGQGYWLCQKRLSVGRFRWWPTAARDGDKGRALLAHELSVLLCAGDFAKVEAPAAWRPLRHGPDDRAKKFEQPLAFPGEAT